MGISPHAGCLVLSQGIITKWKFWNIFLYDMYFYKLLTFVCFCELWRLISYYCCCILHPKCIPVSVAYEYIHIMIHTEYPYQDSVYLANSAATHDESSKKTNLCCLLFLDFSKVYLCNYHTNRKCSSTESAIGRIKLNEKNTLKKIV